MTSACLELEPTLTTSVGLQVQSWAMLRADHQAIANLRRNPGSFPGLTISPTLFKYANDQTVAALVAVLRAVAQGDARPEEYHAWSVLAATSFFGRSYSAHALQKYLHEGAWGITPHMVPHHSLHAISGTISQAFNIQGPNFGIGGGPQAHAEGFLGAASFLADPDTPGLWLILTGHDPEEIPEETDEPRNSPADCLAVALALVRSPYPAPGPHLVVAPADESAPGSPEFRLADFVSYLEDALRPTTQRWTLCCGGTLAWQT